MAGVVYHDPVREVNPRNWKKNPPKGGEIDKINRFREACNRTRTIMSLDNFIRAIILNQLKNA